MSSDDTSAFRTLISAEFPDWDLEGVDPDRADTYEPAPIRRADRKDDQK